MKMNGIMGALGKGMQNASTDQMKHAMAMMKILSEAGGDEAEAKKRMKEYFKANDLPIPEGME